MACNEFEHSHESMILVRCGSVNHFQTFYSPLISETQQILRVVARCEANVYELHEKVNEILEKLNRMKRLYQEKPASVMEDFAEVQYIHLFL